jgi:hypothetical protein
MLSERRTLFGLANGLRQPLGWRSRKPRCQRFDHIGLKTTPPPPWLRVHHQTTANCL